MHDGNSMCVFGVFHVPLGIVLGGVGCLTALFAAPLDNWWHEQYGIDADAWAPFHVMLDLGGVIALLGIIYFWAALRVETLDPRGLAERLSPDAWATLIAMSALIGQLLVGVVLLGGVVSSDRGLRAAALHDVPAAGCFAHPVAVRGGDPRGPRCRCRELGCGDRAASRHPATATGAVASSDVGGVEGLSFREFALAAGAEPGFNLGPVWRDLGLFAAALLLDLSTRRSREGSQSRPVAGAERREHWTLALGSRDRALGVDVGCRPNAASNGCGGHCKRHGWQWTRGGTAMEQTLRRGLMLSLLGLSTLAAAVPVAAHDSGWSN